MHASSTQQTVAYDKNNGSELGACDLALAQSVLQSLTQSANLGTIIGNMFRFRTVADVDQRNREC